MFQDPPVNVARLPVGGYSEGRAGFVVPVRTALAALFR
jgi:hypothetical protein